MRQLGQPQAGDQRQQGRVGNGTGVVHRTGFAAKSKGHWLGLRASRQVIRRVPSAQQGHCQQQAEGNAHRQCGVQKRQGLDGQRPQPIGRQRFKLARLTQQLWA